MTQTTSTAQYARTHSATSRHIVNPDVTTKTLCGGAVRLAEHYIDGNGQPRTAPTWMIRDLPQCKRCETSARRRGIAID